MYKVILVFLLILISSLAQAQPANLVVRELHVYFDGNEGTTAAEQSTYITRYYLDEGPPQIIPTTCTGLVKPWVCKSNVPLAFHEGRNIIRVSLQVNSGGTEGSLSTPLVFDYQTALSTSVNKCKPGTYTVSRILSVSVLESTINSLTKHVSHILGTSNAIYIFSCDLESGL